MPRVDLSVPFSEKDEARSLGARWDARRKVWFVPDGVDPGRFGKWFILEPEINLRAPSYFVVEAAAMCWKCHESTSVVSFMLPPGYEVFRFGEFDGERTLPGFWSTMPDPTIVHYVEHIPPAVADRAMQVKRNYQRNFSKTTSSAYWMNHCDHCGAKQGDFFLHCEVDGAFQPWEEEDAARMVLHACAGPFEGYASWAMFGDFFMGSMQRR